MTWALAVSREFLERALSLARSRQDARALGVRICELMEMEELEELRMLRTPTECPVYDYREVPTAATHAGHVRRMKRALRGIR